MQNTPVLISSSRGVTMAPIDWSQQPESWTILRKLDAMLREIPVMDLVLEAGGAAFKEVDAHDLEAALPKIREWIGGDA